MENLNKKVLYDIEKNFDNDSIKKLNISIDVKEIQKKYESGKELTKEDKDLKDFYGNTVKKFNNDVIRYIANLRIEINEINKEIFESEYMLSINKLYDLVYKIGFNDCLINVVEKLEELDYSKEDIENIINEEIPELDPDYSGKYKEDEK